MPSRTKKRTEHTRRPSRRQKTATKVTEAPGLPVVYGPLSGPGEGQADSGVSVKINVNVHIPEALTKNLSEEEKDILAEVFQVRSLQDGLTNQKRILAERIGVPTVTDGLIDLLLLAYGIGIDRSHVVTNPLQRV